MASPSPILVLSASRDTKAIAWTRHNSGSPFVPSTPFDAGTRFVNAVTYLPPTPEAPQGPLAHTIFKRILLMQDLFVSEGYLVSGGQDTLINVFPIGGKEQPTHTLLGHSDNVCALDATSSGTIVSGSWDK